MAQRLVGFAGQASRRGLVQAYRLLSELGDIRGRTLSQNIVHALSAAAIYLSVVDLPSVVGGTTPMLAAGQAALASSAIARLLLFVQDTAYQAGLQGDGALERRFADFAKGALRNFSIWAAKAIKNAPPEALEDPDMQALRRTVENVQDSPWARHEQLVGELGLLLGQPAVEAGRRAIEGRREQPALMEEETFEAVGGSAGPVIASRPAPAPSA